MSWRHFVIGLRFLARADVRQQMLDADAARLSQADERTYRSWKADLGRMLG